MKVQVNVTRADIDAGLPGVTSKGPEALAIQRATGNPDLVVSCAAIWGGKDKNWFAMLPPDIQAQIAELYHGRGIKPHEWDIDMPCEWVKNGSRK